MRILLYLVLALTVSGCGYAGSCHKELDAAGDLIDSNPAEAFERLSAFDVSEFDDSATMARWALLYSEAMAANCLYAPSDTIINIAVEYYGSHGLKDESERALHLRDRLTSASGPVNPLVSALYVQKEKEFKLYKEKVGRERATLAAIIILIIAVCIIARLRHRLKIKTMQTELLMAEASGLAHEAVTLECTLRSQLDNRFGLIDALCQTYYETQGTKAERKAIADKVKSEIDNIRVDALPEMERVANDCRDNIITRIKNAVTDMKPDDYRLAVYISVGLSTRTICLLLDESAEVVYKRKSRLKKRLKELGIDL